MSDNPYAPPVSRIDQPAMTPARMTRPWQVVAAVWLALINEEIVNYGTSFATRLAVWEAIYGTKLFLLVMKIWVCYNLYHGWNWARMILLAYLLACAVIVTSRFDRMMDHSIMGMAGAVAGVVIDVVCLYFLFISPGRHWFRRRAAKDIPPESPETSKPEFQV
ncbi:MAG: hypothetical protein EOP86_12715 [Verrucomicrobiaceae bacterium]|nr:MAG: hypothetical protein EOP86_12715 [Verrucomicrobiaceae bacterium]